MDSQQSKDELKRNFCHAYLLDDGAALSAAGLALDGLGEQRWVNSFPSFARPDPRTNTIQTQILILRERLADVRGSEAERPMGDSLAVLRADLATLTGGRPGNLIGS